MTSLFHNPGILAGLNVVEIPEAVEVKLSWKDRFLSRPWRPWVKTKIVKNPASEAGSLRYGDTIYLTRSDMTALKQYIVA